ncbi:MAG TPA: DUF4190 domain-containing protein [Polyangiaceae bacterium]
MYPMHGPPPPQGWPVGGPAPSTDGKAVVALVLGILSLVGTFCWLGLPLGLPAIVFGVLASRDIRRSDGMAGGRGMAIAGIVLGSVGTTIFMAWVGFLVFAMVSSKSVASTPTPMPVLPPTPAATATALTPPGGWGRIHVVELHPTTTPLRTQLADEAKAAKSAGETVLVETTAPACSACVEIARSMRDPALQTALGSVRLVHLDVDEFGVEVATIRMSEPALPWFYLVDAHGDPRDGVSADEWDDNDAASIAPVLDAFLHGRLRSRRKAWRGGTSL